VAEFNAHFQDRLRFHRWLTPQDIPCLVEAALRPDVQAHTFHSSITDNLELGAKVKYEPEWEIA